MHQKNRNASDPCDSDDRRLGSCETDWGRPGKSWMLVYERSHIAQKSRIGKIPDSCDSYDI